MFTLIRFWFFTVSYTYWTLSYALTRRGMTKLLAQDPIAKMIPVDEYLPIMFGAHTK